MKEVWQGNQGMGPYLPKEQSEGIFKISHAQIPSLEIQTQG